MCKLFVRVGWVKSPREISTIENVSSVYWLPTRTNTGRTILHSNKTKTKTSTPSFMRLLCKSSPTPDGRGFRIHLRSAEPFVSSKSTHIANMHHHFVQCATSEWCLTCGHTRTACAGRDWFGFCRWLFAHRMWPSSSAKVKWGVCYSSS